MIQYQRIIYAGLTIDYREYPYTSSVPISDLLRFREINSVQVSQKVVNVCISVHFTISYYIYIIGALRLYHLQYNKIRKTIHNKNIQPSLVLYSLSLVQYSLILVQYSLTLVTHSLNAWFYWELAYLYIEYCITNLFLCSSYSLIKLSFFFFTQATHIFCVEVGVHIPRPLPVPDGYIQVLRLWIDTYYCS